MSKRNTEEEAVGAGSLERVTPLVGALGRQMLLAAVSGLLVIATFPDLSLDPLAWIALVPLFAAARGAGGRRGLALGLVCGVAVGVAGFYWIAHAIYEFSQLGALVTGLFFSAWLVLEASIWGIFGFLLGRARRPLSVLLVVAAWTGVEHFYPRIFPWHIGDAFCEREWLRQGADLVGGGGLTHLVLLINAFLYLILEWSRARVGFPRRLGIASLVLIVAFNGYGAWRYGAIESSRGAVEPIRVGLIQPNVDPREKFRVEYFHDLQRGTVALKTRQGAELVVWPEGTAPIEFDATPGADPLARYRDADGSTLFDRLVPVVFGAHSRREGEDGFYNTAAYLARTEAGRTEAALYHKNDLLLFGESIPLERFMPEWIRERVLVGTLARGETSPRMLLRVSAERTLGFRCLICYEAVLPDAVRARAAEDVDFFVNITEDAWYGRTAHVGQHRAVLIMRAVESRTPVVRCTNVGPSGVVTASGDFRATTPIFESATAIASLRPGSLFSVYVHGGAHYPAFALAAAVIIYGVSRRQRAAHRQRSGVQPD